MDAKGLQMRSLWRPGSSASTANVPVIEGISELFVREIPLAQYVDMSLYFLPDRIKQLRSERADRAWIPSILIVSMPQ